MDKDNRELPLSKPASGSFPENDLELAESPVTSNDLEEGVTDVSTMAMAFSPLSTPSTVNNVTRRPTENAVPSETNLQEEAIVTRVLAGDSEAFAELIERYKVAVFNLCARMLGDPTEAEDAAQEVFVRAYTQLHSYQPGRRFSTWLLSIASHYCIDMLRRRKPIVDLDAIAFWKQSDQPEPEERALTGEARDEVRELLNQLPDKYRGVTILRYWQDMSYDEIAETTGLSVATVKTRLFRARELLAKELEKRRNGAAGGNAGNSKEKSRGLFKSKKTV